MGYSAHHWNEGFHAIVSRVSDVFPDFGGYTDEASQQVAHHYATEMVERLVLRLQEDGIAADVTRHIGEVFAHLGVALNAECDAGYAPDAVLDG